MLDIFCLMRTMSLEIQSIVVKPFVVEGDGAEGVVMMKGKRMITVKVQLRFAGVELFVDGLRRNTKVEVGGTLLRDAVFDRIVSTENLNIRFR